MFLIKPYTDETRKALLIFHQVYKLYFRPIDYFADQKYPLTQNSCINIFILEDGIRFYFPPSPYSIFIPQYNFSLNHGYNALLEEYNLESWDNLIDQTKMFHFKLIKTLLTEHIQVEQYLKYP